MSNDMLNTSEIVNGTRGTGMGTCTSPKLMLPFTPHVACTSNVKGLGRRWEVRGAGREQDRASWRPEGRHQSAEELCLQGY